jgi:NAD(P)H-dependent FMN reductase
METPMTRNPRIVAFAASLRTGSFNRSLIRVGADAARAAGADVTLLDLRDYPLPLYDADTEKRDGLPENALRLKEVFGAHDAFLFACPEYNGSVTPLFKNTIDWASRPRDGKPGLGWAKGKPAALLSASNGALGGLRGLYHARWVLQTIGMIVLPGQKALSRAAAAFDADGNLVDPKEHEAVVTTVAALVDVTRRLAG